MLNFKKDSPCKRCIFLKECYTPQLCRHYFVAENIIDRKGRLFAVEILSRPLDSFRVIKNIEQYFDSMTLDEAKRLIRHQISNLLYSFPIEMTNVDTVFLNVDPLLLLDDSIIEELKFCVNMLNKQGYKLIYEITERSYGLQSVIGSILIRMSHECDSIKFAADDYSSTHQTHTNVYDYDYIKICMKDISDGISANYNQFVDELYNLKQNGSKLIAEQVQSTNDFLLVTGLPFDYFQGFGCK